MRSRFTRPLLVLALATLAASSAGCVERREGHWFVMWVDLSTGEPLDDVTVLAPWAEGATVLGEGSESSGSVEAGWQWNASGLERTPLGAFVRLRSLHVDAGSHRIHEGLGSAVGPIDVAHPAALLGPRTPNASLEGAVPAFFTAAKAPSQPVTLEVHLQAQNTRYTAWGFLQTHERVTSSYDHAVVASFARRGWTNASASFSSSG